MKKFSLFVVLVVLLSSFSTAFAAPAATPPSQTVEVCWTKWFSEKCVTIDVTQYANPTLTLKWSGAQPFFGLVIGGEWTLSYEGVETTISANNLVVRASNPNLSFARYIDGQLIEEGTIGEGLEVTPFLIVQSPVTVVIGK
ncbi:hypothetical protein KJ707_03645 [Patescibacteria group bacterium]|nr:hypothetical protein [Patescibacteria group bacterium]